MNNTQTNPKDELDVPAAEGGVNGAGESSPRAEPLAVRSGGRVPPHALEAEQSVIGAVLLDNEAVNTVMEILTPADFYHGSHRFLFETMVNLSENQVPIDAVTLIEALRGANRLEQAGGIEYISRLVDIVPTSVNTQYYARIIKEMSLRRRLIHEATEIANEAFSGRGDIDGFLDTVEKRIFGVSEARINATFSRVGDVVKESIKQVERNYINKEPITGLPTNFIDFDNMTSGLQPSDLIIVAGRPSMGKTALALSLALNVALDRRKKRSVAVFSLEMSKEQITMRLLCQLAKVGGGRVRSGKLGESDFPRLVDAASELSQTNIFIDDTPAISVLEMRAKARRLHRESPLDLIVVDYLQLMRGSSRAERREQEISEISSSLKALAKELSLPVVALSQLNRSVESRQDKRPMMSDLRESGAIEQDADIIGFVYRDEVYNPETQDKGVAEVIIAKHRNGAIGTIRLAFQGEYTLFENLADEPGYDYLGADLQIGDDEELI